MDPSLQKKYFTWAFYTGPSSVPSSCRDLTWGQAWNFYFCGRAGAQKDLGFWIKDAHAVGLTGPGQ